MGQPEDMSLSLTWWCVGAIWSLTPQGLAHLHARWITYHC